MENQSLYEVNAIIDGSELAEANVEDVVAAQGLLLAAVRILRPQLAYEEYIDKLIRRIERDRPYKAPMRMAWDTERHDRDVRCMLAKVLAEMWARLPGCEVAERELYKRLYDEMRRDECGE